jgi:quercetin dioxygenase-like cupin family protein
MNIKELHTKDQPVSASSLFKSELGNATAIQIVQGGMLNEHITKIPALLICIEGEVIFENEIGFKVILNSGDFINIEPMIKHWVHGTLRSQLILIK